MGNFVRRLDWRATVHDQTQFELVTDYRASGGTPGGTDGSDFEVDTYFFTPRTLGLNSTTYPRDEFYRDLTNFIRVHTPNVEAFNKGAIPALARLIDPSVSIAERRKTRARAIQELKLFGNYVNLTIKRADSGLPDAALTAAAETIAIVREFREGGLKPCLAQPGLDSTVRSTLLWVDEYLSARLEVAFSRAPLLNAPMIQETLHAEERHRQAMGYVSARRNASDLELERYYHRQGMLKKFVSEILYLKTNEIRRERTYRNIVAASGAALAGLWAELAKLDSSYTKGAHDFGFRFIVVAAVGIMVYVFKDRIKDMSKEYFSDKMKSYLPDFDVKLSYKFFESGGESREVDVGHYHEYVRYLSDSGLPDDVRFVRNLTKDGDVSGQLVEDVIHYSKRVWIKPDAARAMADGTLSLKDVFRFNMSEFLEYFDNPEKNLSVFDAEEGAVKLRAPKVYHFNILLRLASRNTDGSRRVRLEHVRLVLNKAGIVRVDPVFAEGEHWYEEALA
jgi:hypothetical protein